MAKQKTPLGDILDYLDRVEGRDIHTLSIAKLRERVKERLTMEKTAMIKFAKKTSPAPERDYELIFNEVFESNAKPEEIEHPDVVAGVTTYHIPIGSLKESESEKIARQLFDEEDPSLPYQEGDFHPGRPTE